MAGSLHHLMDDATGAFTMDYLDDMGDAEEALEECWEIIRVLTDGRMKDVNRCCALLKFPSISRDMEKAGEHP